MPKSMYQRRKQLISADEGTIDANRRKQIIPKLAKSTFVNGENPHLHWQRVIFAYEGKHPYLPMKSHLCSTKRNHPVTKVTHFHRYCFAMIYSDQGKVTTTHLLNKPQTTRGGELRLLSKILERGKVEKRRKAWDFIFFSSIQIHCQMSNKVKSVTPIMLSMLHSPKSLL